MITLIFHFSLIQYSGGEGTHPFSLYLGILGGGGLTFVLHVLTLGIQSKPMTTENLFFCLFLFVFFLNSLFLWHFFYFSSTKKIKQTGKYGFEVFPDVGFVREEPTLYLSSSDVRKCPRVWLHVSGKKHGICMYVFACMCCRVCVCARACVYVCVRARVSVCDML